MPTPHDLLLAESRRLKTLAGRQREIPGAVNVGILAGQRICLPLAWICAADQALRTDVVTRALDRVDDPARRSVWLTRSGPASPGDDDLAWRAAARTALARHGVHDAPFYVVTRNSWFEVGSGEGRRWARLRSDPRPVAEPPKAPDRFEGWPIVM